MWPLTHALEKALLPYSNVINSIWPYTRISISNYDINFQNNDIYNAIILDISIG